jgi:hypothetical protein
MAVPGGRNGLRDDDDDIAEHAEVFGGVSDDEEVPPHLRALANAAQTGDVAALLAALGIGLIRPILLRPSITGKHLGLCEDLIRFAYAFFHRLFIMVA